jgi:hypothetical protein
LALRCTFRSPIGRPLVGPVKAKSAPALESLVLTEGRSLSTVQHSPAFFVSSPNSVRGVHPKLIVDRNSVPARASPLSLDDSEKDHNIGPTLAEGAPSQHTQAPRYLGRIPDPGTPDGSNSPCAACRAALTHPSARQSANARIALAAFSLGVAIRCGSNFFLLRPRCRRRPATSVPCAVSS